MEISLISLIMVKWVTGGMNLHDTGYGPLDVVSSRQFFLPSWSWLSLKPLRGNAANTAPLFGH